MFDAKKRKHRIDYAQNFLKNPSLARYLVGLAKIQAQDIVLEIGPGHGILTRALLAKTKHLVLVEKDKELCLELRRRYGDEPTIKIIQTNALKIKLDLPRYTVFSNPPFTILSQVVKKFVFSHNAPEAMFLFMQYEAQRRLSGKSGNNQFSTIIQTFYSIKDLHRFERSDFSPVPAVDVNLVAFYKRPEIKIAPADKRDYIQFVYFGFQQQKSTLEKNFEQVFTYEQWKRLAQTLKFPIKCQPTDLTHSQWTGLFNYYKSGVAPVKKRVIASYEPRT